MLHTGPVLGRLHPNRHQVDPLILILQLRSSYRRAPVEQVALKRKAISPSTPRQMQTTRPTSATTPPCWELAHTRIQGTFREHITPPLKTIEDLPREPPSRRWQHLPTEMGKVNIGLVDEGTKSTLVIIHLQRELYQ